MYRYHQFHWKKTLTPGIWWSIVFWDQVTTTSWPVKCIQARASHRRWRSSRNVLETPTELGGSPCWRWERGWYDVFCFPTRLQEWKIWKDVLGKHVWDEHNIRDELFVVLWSVPWNQDLIVQEVKNYDSIETLPNVIIMTKTDKENTKSIHNYCFRIVKYQLLILTQTLSQTLSQLGPTKTAQPCTAFCPAILPFRLPRGSPDLFQFHSPNRARWPSWRKGPCVLSWHFRWVQSETSKHSSSGKRSLGKQEPMPNSCSLKPKFFNAPNVNLAWCCNSKMQNMHRTQHHQWRWSSDQWWG